MKKVETKINLVFTETIKAKELVDRMKLKFNIIDDYTITPAQLECFCLQATNLADLYKMLEDHYKEKN